jgi:hypothetical protein
MENQRNNGLELADILRQFSVEYQGNHTLCISQEKAYHAIIDCRTSALGSHRSVCDHCGHNRISYNSCRNRHCPKCQYLKQLLWVDKLKSRLLPTRYFHVVFTVPDFLNKLFYINQRQCYDMLFKSAAEAIRKTAANPSFLGAQTGCVSVLHTWGQSLTYHPHVHLLVPAGGMDADGQQWISSAKTFFVPVKALSKIFRACFYRLLEKALQKKDLQLPDSDISLYDNRSALNNKVYEKFWHVHIKKTFRGAGQVISYLGRYTHRVAISNNRLLSLEDGVVKFRWKDYRDHQWKVMALKAACFIGRFLQHILPCGYYKIRYYGIFSSIHAKTIMIQCFALLRSSPGISQYEGLVMSDVLYLITGHDVTKCLRCKKGRMIVAESTMTEVT